MPVSVQVSCETDECNRTVNPPSLDRVVSDLSWFLLLTQCLQFDRVVRPPACRNLDSEFTPLRDESRAAEIDFGLEDSDGMQTECNSTHGDSLGKSERDGDIENLSSGGEGKHVYDDSGPPEDCVQVRITVSFSISP
jgi:hypothetical protein